MNQVIIENNIAFKILSEHESFKFDSENMCNTAPYMSVEDDKLQSAIFIERIQFSADSIFIKGWSVGATLTLSKIKENMFLLTRYNRDDVTRELNVESEDAGFTLQINMFKNKNVSINFDKLQIDLELSLGETDDLNLEPECTQSEFISKSEEVLIVGGAPSIANYLKSIKTFKGEIWALNDAVFWLEENNIEVDKLVIADQRFVEKQADALPRLNCKSLIAADYIDFSILPLYKYNKYSVRILGRDGVSEKLGEAYHGCTVANLALQTARLANYKAITLVGVLLHFPTAYERIDGTKTMPEYVHKSQISNVKRLIQKIREERISLTALEPTSNINFF